MRELLLIRHGEAEHLVGDGDNRMIGGWTDSSLTDNGREQARETAQRLGSLIQSRRVGFYSSDLKRCRQTAEIIRQSILVQPVFTEFLRELNNGIVANCTREEAKAFEIPITEPVIDWTPYPGAESWGNMHSRVTGFMESIRGEDCDQMVIVSHGGPIVAIIHWWLDLPTEYLSKVSFDIGTCSFTRLTINRYGERTISKLNDTCHLSHQPMHNH